MNGTGTNPSSPRKGEDVAANNLADAKAVKISAPNLEIA